MTGQQPPKLIPPHGGYRELQFYQMLEIVYDATVVFCNRFISKYSRTHDQMVQVVCMACLFLIDRRGDGNKHSCLQR